MDGGFAEYIAVPENIFRLGFVNPIPDMLSFDQAAMSEIVACCLNAQQNTPVREGEVVLIIGLGPAGIVHSQLALGINLLPSRFLIPRQRPYKGGVNQRGAGQVSALHRVPDTLSQQSVMVRTKRLF